MMHSKTLSKDEENREVIFFSSGQTSVVCELLVPDRGSSGTCSVTFLAAHQTI